MFSTKEEKKMFKNYRKFINEFDEVLEALNVLQKKYIKCKKGCTYCCEKGEYPLSQIEFAYLTSGFIKLKPEKKIIVQNNIRQILEEKKLKKNERFEYKCPFLIDNKCCVYKYRGIVCRTFGICYYDDKEEYVRLPDCVFYGLNYSEFFDKENNILKIKDVPMVNLRIDSVLNSELAKKYDIYSGEIRPLIDWIDNEY